jgi:hypothetical protein
VSVSAAFDPMSGPLMRTCARRTGVPASLETRLRARGRCRSLAAFRAAASAWVSRRRTDDLDLLADFLLRVAAVAAASESEQHEGVRRRVTYWTSRGRSG